MSVTGSEAPSSATTELALSRNRQAAERTLTSWIQNALTLIMFGLTYDLAIGPVTPEQHAADIPVLTLCALGAGLFFLVLAIVVHQLEMKNLKHADRRYAVAMRLTDVSTIAVILFGIAALAGVYFKIQP